MNDKEKLEKLQDACFYYRKAIRYLVMEDHNELSRSHQVYYAGVNINKADQIIERLDKENAKSKV